VYTRAVLTAPARAALQTLTLALSFDQSLEPQLRAHFRGGLDRRKTPLEADVLDAAELLLWTLPGLTRSPDGAAALGELFGGDQGRVLLAFCAGSTARPNVQLAALLGGALEQPHLEQEAAGLVCARIVEGPLLDALLCVPLLPDGEVLRQPEYLEVRARLEILLWEAGASATPVPELGPWVWGSESAFELLLAEPASGTLRGRALAARCLETAVDGMPASTDPELVGRTLQLLQPLLLHPEPLVWIHAARALGRMAGAVEQLEGTVLDWIQGESQVLRQRAMTALASLPSGRLKALGHELEAALELAADEPWVLAAAAAGTPYLFHEGRPLYDAMAARILEGEGGATAARALARGLASLWRRGHGQAALEAHLSELRLMARQARPTSMAEQRRWQDVIAATDPVDGAERDPIDLERGLENLVHLASKYDDEEADARAARFAVSLAATLEDALRLGSSEVSLRQRAAALNAAEGCARSLALRLWAPQLITHPRGESIAEPDLADTWRAVAEAPTRLIKAVAERRAGKRGAIGEDGADGEAPTQLVEAVAEEDLLEYNSVAHDADAVLALEVTAVRIGGYALDACAAPDLGPRRGESAHATCRWLRRIDGLADGSRQLPAPLEAAIAAVLWRLVDATRGTALGAVDDVEWLGPFAAWWGLVIDRPSMLQRLGTSLPMIAEGALEHCCEHAEALRTAIASGDPGGEWELSADVALSELKAEDTELANALGVMAACLRDFGDISGVSPKLIQACLGLVFAAERLRSCLADPERALHPATLDNAEDTLSQAATLNAPRTASLLARAIRAREMSMLEVWLASLGPITSKLIEGAVSGAMRRTPPPPPVAVIARAENIGGYDLVQPLGEGGVGKVWLVRKPGADRLFVLKLPKGDALAAANETEREGIVASFTKEAQALAGLYHPNVANIIDRGVADGMPYLVLELLIGADLSQYAKARLLSLFELRQIVLDACAGLEALHRAGLVHRDIKPANLWLRLPLSGSDRFDPDKHRDPARAQPLSTVVIDFGMVRASHVAAEAAGRFVAGTAGYIAPDQVLDPVDLDGRADIYALAGTIYNLTTGRTFFDEIQSPRDRIFAHMNRDPFEDASRLELFPKPLGKLLRAATAKDPRDRPMPMEFARAFGATL